MCRSMVDSITLAPSASYAVCYDCPENEAAKATGVHGFALVPIGDGNTCGQCGGRNLRYDNAFTCPNQSCGYFETIDGDDCRHHMYAEYLGDGETDEQYGLYRCPECSTEGWSQLVVSEYL